MDLENIKKEALREIRNCHSLSALDEISRRYLGKKGLVADAFRQMKDGPVDQRRDQGQVLNRLKDEIESAVEGKGRELKEEMLRQKEKEASVDIHYPGKKFRLGHLHPLTRIINQVEDIFQLMGFSVVEGPEIETEYYNFDALNIPPDHPARDAWDTFWLEGRKKGTKNLLRTHTSPNQIRYMEKNHPPLRIIVPGACYRHEATDRFHGFQFFQIEGLMVDRQISVGNFKAVVERFCADFFGPETVFRITPDYFPFTEPSFEVSIQDREGRWLEIMGAGLVHPAVFKAVGYHPYEWQGFAFGVGVDRLAMLKYGLDDVRLLYQGDLRLIQQF